ncbi:MAG: FMN-binding protein [Oscillospiraceae bacterium]|nr:FMN-binding protein [Oscillospiraceae bacterium]
MFKDKIKPSLVLTLICMIACGLLVAAYEATYTDNTGVITEELKTGIAEVYGSAEGFEMLKNDDGTVLTFEGVTSVLSDGSNTAFEITADGYSKGGLHLLVGIDGYGSVSGISVISIGETPGLGTKVQDKGFLSQFNGITAGMTAENGSALPSDAKAVWGISGEIKSLQMNAELQSGGEGFTLDAVTGATFSSKGVYSAVKTALAAYGELKGSEQ